MSSAIESDWIRFEALSADVELKRKILGDHFWNIHIRDTNAYLSFVLVALIVHYSAPYYVNALKLPIEVLDLTIDWSPLKSTLENWIFPIVSYSRNGLSTTDV